jgi:hypothetical protein
MAGDWIKVEHATLDKPEVLRMAELLGINRNEMLGVLLNYFVWLDRNCSNGYVTHMSRKSIDSVLHMDGLSACLIDVGWIEIDEKSGTLTVKNWARHNGTPAKTRALTKDRVATHRSRNSNAQSVTREEKRRGTTSSLRSEVVGAPTKSAAVLQSPTDEHRLAAKAKGIDCDAEWQRYVDWLAANGKVHRDRAAGFRNWLSRANAPPLRAVPGAKSQAERRAEVNAAIWGVRNEQQPTDITGESERVA